MGEIPALGSSGMFGKLLRMLQKGQNTARSTAVAHRSEPQFWEESFVPACEVLSPVVTIRSNRSVCVCVCVCGLKCVCVRAAVCV